MSSDFEYLKKAVKESEIISLLLLYVALLLGAVGIILLPNKLAKIDEGLNKVNQVSEDRLQLEEEKQINLENVPVTDSQGEVDIEQQINVLDKELEKAHISDFNSVYLSDSALGLD
jgi:uncharacterized protein HemX